MRRSRWKRSVLDLLMYRENQRCRFGAKWKEIWLRLGAFFFYPGASRDNGDDHLGLESSSTAY